MDLLNRTELQINQAENDIYEDLRTSHENLSNLANHAENLNDNDCHISADNFNYAKSAHGSDPLIARLQSLISARVELLMSKIEV